MTKALWDAWLGRLSHISQILLCVFSAWALYYTVIPLYKIATLEETIAQREIELKSKNLELTTAKTAIEAANVELYVIKRNDYLRNMVSGDLLECTEPQLFALEKFDPYSVVIDRVYSRCINESFNRTKAQKHLQEKDYKYLSRSIDDLKSKLIDMREDMIRDMDTLATRARKDKTILEPKGPSLQKVDELYRSLGGTLLTEEEEFDQAVSRTMFKMVMDYSGTVHSEILKLRSINWAD
ncbi:hypothetical protein OU997_13835 [Pseudomonas sp. SL4(2022)]|uniref:hypothetical protein n=1 Tax=Pseudomonas sp. SL4(2022) TaxID=2994661 RepID=UPI00227184A4|nr:hypothetical protein [Pseudomonas sp. SL4(2022)]WAC43356.1 hypothetical protein OU997_13835 [Pseudomonas sp. SL4(2022)]